MKKSQMRGYLYEIFVSHLLQKNGFLKCTQGSQQFIDMGIISNDGEIVGRGTQHQIDFIGLYTRNIPFVFPIRLLGECKFWEKKVDKSFIRQYIGIHKDISENYISSMRGTTNRFLDIPVIFSASDFDKEAVNLAWAQGINLVSHSRLPILKNIIEVIKIIVETLYDHYDYQPIKRFVERFLNEEDIEISETYLDFITRFIEYLNNNLTIFDVEDFVDSLSRLQDSRINTFLFATNEKGILINLISEDTFPNKDDDFDVDFFETNSEDCMIYFDDENSDENGERVFYITLNRDPSQRKFYFQANNALLSKDFPQLSLKDRMERKLEYFSELSIIKEVNGLTRIIKLNVNLETVMHNNVR
ncbi:hypothetical protein [Aliarcobacter lanthieri]|uniref:hypothetical protein n=1 Tax=Aliarcobacter lanthieri TaxID=1355374 RepID=UPI00047A7983|nr:hypothetical protein [Aliarcobacter lanthieri]QKF59081.1 hypothetical protein ALANTH_0967 [Aliarcobacter lanthieri]